MDGEAGVPDASFDGALSAWLIDMRRPATALREWRRALKPGRRVAVIVFSTPERNHGVRCRLRSSAGARSFPSSCRPARTVQLGRPRGAGRTVPASWIWQPGGRAVPVPLRMPAAADYVTVAREAFGAFNSMMASLPAQERDSVWNEVEASMRSFESPDGSRFRVSASSARQRTDHGSPVRRIFSQADRAADRLAEGAAGQGDLVGQRLHIRGTSRLIDKWRTTTSGYSTRRSWRNPLFPSPTGPVHDCSTRSLDDRWPPASNARRFPAMAGRRSLRRTRTAYSRLWTTRSRARASSQPATGSQVHTGSSKFCRAGRPRRFDLYIWPYILMEWLNAPRSFGTAGARRCGCRNRAVSGTTWTRLS